MLSSSRILNQAKDIGLQERLIQAANKSDCDEESKRQIAYLLEQFDKIGDSTEFGGESECSEMTDGSESPSDDGYQGGDDEEDDTIVSPIILKPIHFYDELFSIILSILHKLHLIYLYYYLKLLRMKISILKRKLIWMIQLFHWRATYLVQCSYKNIIFLKPKI